MNIRFLPTIKTIVKELPKHRKVLKAIVCNISDTCKYKVHYMYSYVERLKCENVTNYIIPFRFGQKERYVFI